MAKIQIYARVRPTDNSYEGIRTSKSHVHISTGDEDPQIKFSKAPRSKHEFRFNHVFEQNTTQEEVFETVAKHMVDSFLEGFNGTVFAYGQTSSGKTHTIEGSGRRFADRGLIPRILSYIYRALEKRGEGEENSIHVSYMEIYQDVGYDLLNAGMRPGALMVTLPKVNISELATGEIVVRHLSSHLAATEEVAQSLLFQGSTCRRVAETSMNQCSSRSHSIFTVTLTSKSPGSEVITKSKLNLVDLAGSERVAKTGVDGKILQEAKHINLSLHHLEHVIVSLQQRARHGTVPPSSSRVGTGERHRELTPTRSQSRSPATRHSSPGGPQSGGVRRTPSSSSGGRENSGPGTRFGSPRPRTRGGGGGGGNWGHIPYRNCMLTMVLRDSLGGNCLTAMIATVSAEEQNIWETISTCRFSQRVACIMNTARRNEELDDKAVIRRLKQRITELEKEVTILREGTATDQQLTEGASTFSQPLADSDKQQCHQVLYDFFHGRIENPVVAGINTAAKFQECLLVLRDIVMHALRIKDTSKGKATPTKPVQANPVEELTNQVRASVASGRSIERENTTKLGNPLWEVESTAGVTRRQAWQAEASESRTPTAESGSSYKLQKQRQHPVVESSPHDREKRQPQANLTPSPNSRLSSGFGSLQEEDDTLYESSSDRKRNTTQQSLTSPRSSVSADVPYSHTTSRQAVGINASPLHTSPHHESIATRSRDAQILTSPPEDIGKVTKSSSTRNIITSGNDSSKNRQHPLTLHTPSYPSNALSPTSPPFEQHHVSKPLSQTSSVEQHRAFKPLSPTDERALLQLKERQVQLQRSREERQKLSSDVQLLDLRVQEEELRGQLSRVSEQLASQHVKVLRAQQSEATTEQICAERIAEQQLRIKQAKLHQKLLDVQYQAKMHHGEASTSSKTEENVATPAISPQVSTPRVLNELARHEMRQSKVQQQIEKLKVSQIEKQLELKEVATRRKIQALRQQFQASGTVTQPAPPPSLHPNTTADQSHNIDRLALAHSNPSVALTANPHNGYVLPHTHEIERPCISQQVSGTVQRAKAIGNPPATAPVTVMQERPGIRSGLIPRSESDHTTGSVNGDWHMLHAQKSCDKQTTKPAHVQTSCNQTVSISPNTQMAYITPRANPSTSGTHYNQSTFGSLLKTHAPFPTSSNSDYRSTNSATTTASKRLPIGRTNELHRHSECTDSKKTASPKVDVLAKSSIRVENTPTVYSHLVPVSGADIQHATSANEVRDRLRRSPEASVTNTVEHSNTRVHINQSGESASLRKSQTAETLQSRSTSTSEPPNPSQQDNIGTRPRLTLPEEVKETEYMTALQRQKARVSRIRRCITAATVIQRAWREYKYMCRQSKC